MTDEMLNLRGLLEKSPERLAQCNSYLPDRRAFHRGLAEGGRGQRIRSEQSLT